MHCIYDAVVVVVENKFQFNSTLQLCVWFAVNKLTVNITKTIICHLEVVYVLNNQYKNAKC